MKGITDDMKSLCEDILNGDKDRKKEIEEIKGQAEAIRDNTKKFLATSRELRKEMSKELKKDLRKGREELTKKVNAIRENFNKKEQEIRADLAEASKIWDKMKETLRSRKTKSPD